MLLKRSLDRAEPVTGEKVTGENVTGEKMTKAAVPFLSTAVDLSPVGNRQIQSEIRGERRREHTVRTALE